MNTRIVLSRLAVAFFLMVGLSACREQTTQISEEHRAINRLMPLLSFYEADFPGVRVTNLAQVFHDRPYPYGLEEIFRAFEGNAGFTNSFYEKYAFPSGVVTNHYVEGEILFLNAAPFPNRKGQLGRMVVSKPATSNAVHRIMWLSEDGVQKVFAEAGVEIPKPPSMPQPPAKPALEPPDKEMQPPPFFKITSAIDNFAVIYGLNGFAIRLGLVVVAVATMFFIAFWLWRKSRR
jgi:hypothetical protein